MSENNVKILILSAGMITGAFRRVLDIVENINNSRFNIYVTYKPEYATWGKEEIDAIIRFGGKIIPLRGKRLFDLRGFIDLFNILKNEKIDILHSWDVLGVPGRIIGKIAGVKIVEEFGNPPPELRKEISIKHYIINKITSIFVDGYIACSNEIMQKYIKQRPVFFKQKTLSTISNCVALPDVDKSPRHISFIRKNYGLADSNLILTNVGYFNEQKAQQDLIDAFKKVVDKRKDVRLFIVGWGPLENRLKGRVRELGLEDKVIFTGKLVRSDVFEVLAISDIFVLSSHWEGFGIVLVEAMSLGKPVISTKTDGSKEVVEDGKTGILVPAQNPTILADTILDILEKPDLMDQMGEEGFLRATRLYNCEKFIQDYESYFRKILTAKRSKSKYVWH